MSFEYPIKWEANHPSFWVQLGTDSTIFHTHHTHIDPKDVTEEKIEAMSLFKLGQFKGKLKADLHYFEQEMPKSKHPATLSKAIIEDIQLLAIVKTAIKQKVAQEKGRSLAEAFAKLKLAE